MQSINLEISGDFPPLLTFHTRRVVRACMKAVYHRVLTGANPREEPCELGVAHAYMHAYVMSLVAYQSFSSLCFDLFVGHLGIFSQNDSYNGYQLL